MCACVYSGYSHLRISLLHCLSKHVSLGHFDSTQKNIKGFYTFDSSLAYFSLLIAEVRHFTILVGHELLRHVDSHPAASIPLYTPLKLQTPLAHTHPQEEGNGKVKFKKKKIVICDNIQDAAKLLLMQVCLSTFHNVVVMSGLRYCQ